MIVSQPALLCLSTLWNNLTGRASMPDAHAGAVPEPAALPPAARERAATIRDARGRHVPQPETSPPVPQPAPHATVAASATLVEEGDRAADSSTQAAPGGVGPLTANERRARAAALRALALSRARHFDAAQAAFRDAATLDPALDLTRVPAFWSLERAAHEAAIAAYTDAGRTGDAAVLRARVQSVYRPKPLRPRNAVAAT